MHARSLSVALAIFSVAGCALTVSYDDYERSKATGSGGSTGIGGGGTFGGGSGAISDSGNDTSGGSGGSAGSSGSGGSGGVACTNDDPCGADTVCQDHYCDGAFCQVTNLTNDDCAPAICTGATESTPNHCENGRCIASASVNCQAFKCFGGICLTDCNGNDDCASGALCDNGGCVPCVPCSAKLADPTLMAPLCEPQSYALGNALLGCCVTYCQDYCGGAAPFLVCGGTSLQIDSICLGCLADANFCKSQLVSCQTDQ